MLALGEIQHRKAASILEEPIQRLVDRAGVDPMPLRADEAMAGGETALHPSQFMPHFTGPRGLQRRMW